MFNYEGENMDRIQMQNVSVINETPSDAHTIIESKERKETEKNIYKQKTRTNVSDSVELSGTARLMSVVQQEIAMIDEKEQNGFSEEQRKKIEHIKEQISLGEYTIDTKKVAKNLLLEENILFK